MAKHKFTNRELCHAWAHQSVDYGEGSNFRFNGPDLFSYGTQIGTIYPTTKGPAWVLNMSKFSVSTSKHQTYARMAVPSDSRLVTYGGDSRRRSVVMSPREIVSHLFAGYIEPVDASNNVNVKRTRRLGQLFSLEAALNAAKLLELSILTDLQTIMDGVAQEFETLKEEDRLYTEEQHRKRDERWVAKQEKNKREWAENAQQLLDKWCGCVQDMPTHELGYASLKVSTNLPNARNIFEEELAYRRREEIEQWVNGGIDYPSSGTPIVLRVKDGIVETSAGAKIPLASARRIVPFILAHRETGWKRNGETVALGPYQLDEIIPSFGITAGCHRISWESLDSFARSQGWL